MSEIVYHTEFPELIDNTAREQFVCCPRKFFLSSIQKLGPNPPSIHLHAGGAYAAGLEVMRKSFYDQDMSEQDSLDAGIEAAILYYGDYDPPEDSVKSCNRVVGALVSYAAEYPLATDIIKPYRLATRKSAVEFTFVVPIPEVPHPVTKQPLLYGGRFDMLAVREDILFVEDDKTTSQLGATWGQQWDLNSQFTGYVWAARSYGYEVGGAIVRGQSFLKNGYGHAQHLTYRSPWIVERWYNQLVRDLKRAVAAFEEGYFDYALGSACAHYGGCEFKRICESKNPEQIIPIYYKNKHWNPLAKDPEEGGAVK